MKIIIESANDYNNLVSFVTHIGTVINNRVFNTLTNAIERYEKIYIEEEVKLGKGIPLLRNLMERHKVLPSCIKGISEKRMIELLTSDVRLRENEMHKLQSHFGIRWMMFFDDMMHEQIEIGSFIEYYNKARNKGVIKNVTSTKKLQKWAERWSDSWRDRIPKIKPIIPIGKLDRLTIEGYIIFELDGIIKSNAENPNNGYYTDVVLSVDKIVNKIFGNIPTNNKLVLDIINRSKYLTIVDGDITYINQIKEAL